VSEGALQPPPRRRKRWAAAGGLVLAPLLMFAAGPRPQVETRLQPVELPQDLDGYLARREAAFADLRPDCEARIVWHDSQSKSRTPWAVVSLHGFSASRMEAAPLWEQVAKGLEANLFEARLAGHGRSQDAMADGTASAWLRDGAEALAIGRRLGERVLLVGCSTGATLATWLAANGHDQGLGAVVLMSPNYGVRNPAARVLSWPWGRQIVGLVEGEYRQFQVRSEAHGAYWTWRYPSHVLVEMQALVDATTASDLGGLTAPALVIASREDSVIDPAAVAAHYPQIGATRKRLEWLRGDGDDMHHVLAGDVLSPGTTERVRDLVVRFAQGGDR
jgi:esterase/lipase